MEHIVVGDKHYVASGADIRKSDHRVPAGMLYEIDLAIAQESPSLETQGRILHDIAKAENRQWRNRMIAAGLAAGTAYAVLEHLIAALFG